MRAAANRGMGILVLWLISFIIMKRKLAEEALQRSYRELEQRVEDRTAQLRQINASLQDEITERKHAEEIVRESEARLHSIASTALDAVILVDNDGAVSFWNEAATRMFGYTNEEIAGKFLHSYIMPQRHVDSFRKGFEAFRTTGAGPFIGKVYEAEAKRKDGTEFPVELSLASLKLKGKWNAVCIVRDITERKQAEELRAHLSAIVESTSTAILSLTKDLDGVIKTWNKGAERVYGYTAEEAIGRSISMLVPPDHPNDVPAILDKIKRGEHLERYETLRMRKDGDLIHVAIDVSPIKDSKGNLIGGSTIGHDITEHKRAEDQIRQSKKLSEALNRINALIYSTLDIDEIMNRVVVEVAKAADADAAVIYLPEDDFWIARYIYGLPKLAGKHLTEEDIKYSTIAVKERRPVVLNNVLSNKEMCGVLVTEYGVKALLDAPLLVGEDTIGDFSIYSCTGVEVFSEQHVDFINKVTASVSLAVKNAHLFKSLSESEERFRNLADNISQLVWMADEKGDIFWFNNRWLEYTGTTPDEIRGRSWLEVLHPGHARRVQDSMQRSFETGEPWEDTFPVRGKDGNYRWFLARAIPIRNEPGMVVRWFGTKTDITDRMRMEEEIKQMAQHDMLTGLPNRRLFNEIIAVELAEARRNNKKLAVFFLDLDRFKEINDTLGHETGDELLKQAAARLRAIIRTSDTVARMGGDEFIMIIPDIYYPEYASEVAQKILKEIRRPFTVLGHELTVSTSIGISIFPNDSEEIDSLLRYADIAMYHVKERSRNTYQFYNPVINTRSLERMRFENSLRQAIDRSEFRLYYQPLVDVKTGKIVSAEVLLRWQHPERGLLMPDQFLNSAENIGLMADVDEWVLKTASRQISAWIDEGVSPVCVTVNLSSRQFQNQDLSARISKILEETGLPPECLDIEIPESVAMGNIENTISRIGELTRMGVHVSIDDFGTGYSSLSYLKRLPIQKLKIDKTFVKDIATSPNDRAIIRAVLLMAHSMNLRVVAEGVEKENQLSFLRELQCDEAQGFLFSEPLPAEKFRELAKTGK